MPGCPDACDCHVEAVRGLQSTGTATDVDPYQLEPAPGRTLPQTGASRAALGAGEVGQVGFSTDESLLYSSAGGGYHPVGPKWGRRALPDLAFAAAPAYCGDSLTLGPGYWRLTGKAKVTVFVPAVSFVSVAYRVYLSDIRNGLELDQFTGAANGTGSMFVPFFFVKHGVLLNEVYFVDDNGAEVTMGADLDTNGAQGRLEMARLVATRLNWMDGTA